VAEREADDLGAACSDPCAVLAVVIPYAPCQQSVPLLARTRPAWGAKKNPARQETSGVHYEGEPGGPVEAPARRPVGAKHTQLPGPGK